MKALIVYGVSGLASLFILGYSVHIMVGGMVEARTETIMIVVAELIAIVVMGWMVWDVRRRRKYHHDRGAE